MKKGFTLLECLLVTVLMLILIGAAVPFAVHQRRLKQTTALQWRGRMIAVYMRATEVETYAMFQRVLVYRRADPAVFGTSTELFRDMVAHGLMGEPATYSSRSPVPSGFAWFGGSGVPELDSWDPDAFSATYNAWCITEGPDPYVPEMAPVLFTRNVVMERIGPGVVPELSDMEPLGPRGWIFATRAGSVHFFSADFIQFWSTGSETRLVLRP